MLRGKNQKQEMPDTESHHPSVDCKKLPSEVRPFIKASAEYLGLCEDLACNCH